jgi:hypothetical protein
MANYYSPTVIQPTIPVAAMTPLERLLLENIFSAEPVGGELYFYAEEGPLDFIVLSRGEIEEAFAASNGTAGTAVTYIAERLSRVAPEEAEIDLDLSGASIWEFILCRHRHKAYYVEQRIIWSCALQSVINTP